MGAQQLQIPATARVIHVDTPWATPREFARRTSLSESAVRSMISRGEFVWSLLTHLQELYPYCAGMGYLEVIELRDTEHA